MKFCMSIVLLLTTNIAVADIIFESDFSLDLGYTKTQTGLFDSSDVPTGWSTVRVPGDSVISVVEDPAIANKPVLKLKWDPALAQPTVNLGKHLTGNINTGYSELYIRYQVRLPSNFKAGDGGTLAHWKWGRLWQNTAPTNPGSGQPGAWTENRVDAFYVVWNWAGGVPYTDINSTWGANEGVNLDQGSAGGERYRIGFFRSGSVPESQPGFFESVGNGAWDFYTQAESTANAGFLKNKNQDWHTIEYRFKLASSITANDAVSEVWVDGVKQDDGNDVVTVKNGGLINSGGQGWREIVIQSGAKAVDGIPTAKNGSGFNFLTFFDNMQQWNQDWADPGVDGFIYVNDVVVSDEYIGHDYVVGQPSPPTNLTVSE
jgi:hypothetical protein